MATKNQQDETGLLIKGTIDFEGAERGKGGPGIYAHALDAAGTAIGSAPVAADGTFEIRVPLRQPADVSVAITPEADAASVRKSQSHVTAFKASEWQRNTLQPQLKIPRLIWWPWRPIRVCVNGARGEGGGARRARRPGAVCEGRGLRRRSRVVLVAVAAPV